MEQAGRAPPSPPPAGVLIHFYFVSPCKALRQISQDSCRIVKVLPQAGGVGAGDVDNQHIREWAESADTRHEIVDRLCGGRLVFPEVDSK